MAEENHFCVLGVNIGKCDVIFQSEGGIILG